LNSEKRHFLSYLNFANEISGNEAAVAARLSVFLAADAELITGADEQFRFHSGAPGI